MGDRLVSVFRHNDEIVAASYQHWAASDYETMENIITEEINDFNKYGGYKLIDDIPIEEIKDYNKYAGVIDPRSAAVKILYRSLVTYNGGSSEKIGLLVNYKDFENGAVADVDELKFASLHPEIPSDPDKIHRSYGMISIDPKRIDSWREWADYEAEFEI